MTRTELNDCLLQTFFQAIASTERVCQEGRKDRVICRYWPTEASAMTPIGVVGRCRRRTYYSQQNLPVSENDIQSIGRFKVGKELEKWVQSLSQDAEIYLDGNKKIEFPINKNKNVIISGEVDILYKIKDEIVGGEIKTSYGYYFTNSVFHKLTIPGMPRISNLMQTMLYLYYYKTYEPETKINKFVITYIDRGSMDWINHVIELTDDLYPIVNGITLKNIDNFNNVIFKSSKLNTSKTYYKLRPYEFNIQNILDRFCEIYEYHESGLLHPKEYNPLWSPEYIEQKRRSGDLGSSSYKAYHDGKIPYLCDTECNFCPYRKKCMTDDGII